MKSHRNIPFGYMMRGGEIVLHPEESVAVREIFDMYPRGMSLKSIAALMTVPYNVDKVWNKNMVSRILENEKYIGADGYPAVIEENMFRKANEIKQRKAAACICTDEKKKYLHSLISGGSSLTESEVEGLLVSVINKLIAKPELAAPDKPQEYVPTAEIADMEQRLADLMQDMTADIDKITKLIVDIASTKYEACPYDNRDRTMKMLELLTACAPMTELDIDLSRQIVKKIHINKGISTVELVNGKMITA
ncbi:MAG: recombinase family protein [Ruminiclostridium sp.]|nr:recombinase family protein [Ruminiclostridium sp.]